jgi:hypothetical protein
MQQHVFHLRDELSSTHGICARARMIVHVYTGREDVRHRQERQVVDLEPACQPPHAFSVAYNEILMHGSMTTYTAHAVDFGTCVQPRPSLHDGCSASVWKKNRGTVCEEDLFEKF